MTNRRSAATAVVALVLLGACDARYRDVSSESEQAARIGQTCEVLMGLRAHGVTRRLEREKRTDYVSIWNPGFTGPEMTFLVILKPGTKFQVTAARECSNCPFDRMLEYEVKVSPEPAEFAGKPAYLRSESMVEPIVRCPAPNAA